MLNVDGYYIDDALRKDKTSNNLARGIGGGLLVYVRNDVIVEPIEDSNDFVQFCRFKVYDKNRKNPMNFTLFYRSPNSSVENNVELVNVLKDCPKNSFVIGDANYPRLSEFAVFSGSPDTNVAAKSRSGELLANAVHGKFMKQTIDFPTHVKGNTLDVCFTDIPDSLISCENIGNLGNSDHAIIKLEIDFCPSFNESCQKVRDWRRGDCEGLARHLARVNFEQKFHGKNAEEEWGAFKEELESALDTYIPLIDRRKQGDPPWMNRNVKRVIRKKQRKWRVYVKNRTEANFRDFKMSEKEARRSLQSAKRRFEKSIASNKNKRPFNSYIKSKTHSKGNVGPLKVNGSVITSSKDMACVLNEYFASVFTPQNPGPVPTPTDKGSANRICDVLITSGMVKKKLLKLNPCSAPGPDGISARFLKEHADVLAPPLATLFNQSLREGVVPLDWRRANVTPIHKKGGKSEPGNYRPVSLTSIPCRIMEACLRDEIVSHLEVNNLISSSQHGFMRKKSVTTNLLEFLESVTTSIDEGQAMDIIYLDFAKAFDKVPHPPLLAKLKAHAIDGNLLQWVGKWLSGRTQRTVLNGQESSWEPVTSGVPQGSVLGPLAFLVFINDLDEETDLVSLIKKFADDTKLAHKVSCHQDAAVLQAALDNLCDWADRWGMAFNTAKCKVMHVGRGNIKANYTMQGQALSITEQERDIGVLVSHDLKPSRQCAEAARRGNAVLGQIARAFHYRNRYTFLSLYKQYVRPHLEFAVPAWSPWSASDRQVLEKVQKRAIKMVSGLTANTYEGRLAELGLLSLEARRVKYDLVQTFKILHGYDRVDWSHWFTLVGTNPDRVTRGTSDPLNIVRRVHNLDLRRHFFSNRVVEHWNSLPSATKSAVSVTSFKELVMPYLKTLDARLQL